MRGELGAVEADTADVVPTRFLFRTGGSTTVRGYDYESLGVSQGGAIVGGRALAVASVEYVHWLQRWGGNWGVAGFVDVGDAADSFKEMKAAVGVGMGVRWRTVGRSARCRCRLRRARQAASTALFGCDRVLIAQMNVANHQSATPRATLALDHRADRTFRRARC